MRSLPPWFAAGLLCMAAHAGAQEHAAGLLKIGHPWTRSTVPGQTAGGGFMTIDNAGGEPDRLLDASSPAADHVELHSMSLDGTVMRMREVPGIDLPAGRTVALEPGRLHLMLVGLKQPLKAGAKVPLTLRFQKAGAVQVELLVQAPNAAGAAAGSHPR
jgi:copper(I)-binding protein